MLRNDAQWLALTDEFQAAAIDGTRWYPALEALAEATGSRSGQLIGLGSNAAVAFNLVTNMDPAALRAFVECGGADPRVSPRVRAGCEADILQVQTEADFLTPEAQERHPHYQDFARPWDIPYSCLTPIERRDDM